MTRKEAMGNAVELVNTGEDSEEIIHAMEIVDNLLEEQEKEDVQAAD